jgi:hypothetical protein
MDNFYPELPRTLPVTFSATAFFMDVLSVGLQAIDMVQIIQKV